MAHWRLKSKFNDIVFTITAVAIILRGPLLWKPVVELISSSSKMLEDYNKYINNHELSVDQNFWGCVEFVETLLGGE